MNLINPQSYFIPYIYAISSNFFFILAQFIAKLQTSLVSPMFIIYYRSLIMLIFNTFLIWRQNLNFNKNIIKSTIDEEQKQQIIEQNNKDIIQIDIIEKKTFLIMIKRIIFACMSMTFYTMALKNVELSITNALFQTAPIFAFFIDAAVSKIKILKVHLLLTLFSFLGVILIMLPQRHSEQPLNNRLRSTSVMAYLLPLASAITSACSMSYLHELKDKVHPLLTMQYLMFGALITSGILFNFEPQNSIIHESSFESYLFSSIKSPLFIISTIVMSLLVFLSQYFRVKSLFILPASKVAPLHYLGIILSILFDLLFFGYKIKWYQYIGMILASSGLFLKVLAERQKLIQNENSQGRKSPF